METTMYRVTVTDSSTSVTASVEVKVVGSYCDDSEKVKLCHIPPGNPDSKELHEICVSKNAVSAHLAHGYWGGGMLHRMAYWEQMSRTTRDRDRHAHLSREVDGTRNKIHFTFITLHDINTSAILQSTHACLLSSRFENPEKEENCILNIRRGSLYCRQDNVIT